MELTNLPLPEPYLQSADFRFFRDWFALNLTKVQYDIENFLDLYDPLRCPSDLIWALADTVGYKYDDRLPVAFNRLVLIYFMSMIYSRGSKDGVTLGAEINLAQFPLILKATGYKDSNGEEIPGNDILFDRLEDTSIPVNSVYVTAHQDAGYVDIIYFSTKKPVDACLEYVRPAGMFLFQHAGVRYDARTRIEVDAKLSDNINVDESNPLNMSIGPTRVGHYRRDDYASMQKVSKASGSTYQDPTESKRQLVWARNGETEGTPEVDAGYRALYSLQLANNEHVMKALIDPIFSLGYGPLSDTDTDPANKPNWNLQYIDDTDNPTRADVIDRTRTVTGKRAHPVPAINPIMKSVGDAMSLNDDNTEYHINED